MADLNRNELEALRILWAEGELKPADIEAGFSWPIDNGTLRSVLRVLMDKQYVARRKDGKAYFYKAKQSREGLLQGMTRRMAHVFSGGSAAGLIAQLIRTERLTPSETEELRLIASEKSGAASRNIRGKKK